MAYLNKEFVANQVLKAEELNGIVSYINGLDNQALQDQIDKHQATLNEWKDRLNQAEKDVNQLAQNLSDAALESLKKELGDAKNKYADALKKIEDAKALIEDGKVIIANTLLEIKEAQDKINEAKDILEGLSGSEGDAGLDIIKELAQIREFTKWYDENTETISELYRISDAVKAIQEEVVTFINTNSGTITTLTDALKGQDGLIISVAELVDTVTNNKYTVTSELNALKALIDQNARNINTNTGKILDVGIRIDGIEDSIKLHAESILTVEGKVANVEVDLQGVQGEITAKGEAISVLNNEVGLFSTRISAAEKKAEESMDKVDLVTADVLQYKKTIDLNLKKYEESLSDVQTEVGTVSKVQEEWTAAGLDPSLVQRVATLEENGGVDEVTQSTIELLKNQIGLVVTKSNGKDVVNTAAIVTAINNSSSSVTIKADQINLIGDTLADKLSTIDLSIGGDSSHFNSDGSGYVANGAISWDEKGTVKGISINAPMYINKFGLGSQLSKSITGSYLLAAEDKIFSRSGGTLYCITHNGTISCTISNTSGTFGLDASFTEYNGDTYFSLIMGNTSTNSYKCFVFKVSKNASGTYSMSQIFTSTPKTGGVQYCHMYVANNMLHLIHSQDNNGSCSTQFYRYSGGLFSSFTVNNMSTYCISLLVSTTFNGKDIIIVRDINGTMFSTPKSDGLNWYIANRDYDTSKFDSYPINTTNGLLVLTRIESDKSWIVSNVTIASDNVNRLQIYSYGTKISEMSGMSIVGIGGLCSCILGNYNMIICRNISDDQYWIMYFSKSTFHGILFGSTYPPISICVWKNIDQEYNLIYVSNGSLYVRKYTPTKIDLVSYVLDAIG